MSLIQNALKAAKQGSKVTKPFVSAVDKAALALTRPKGTGKEFMTELSKTKGVKPAEIEHRKLPQIEAMPKMTKEQFLAELEKRPPADVSETVLKPISDELRNEAADDIYGVRSWDLLDPMERQIVDESLIPKTAGYEEYKMPGGENYREILLQLPHFQDNDRLMYLEAKQRHGGLHPALETELNYLKKQKADFGEPYQSRHWDAENPNVLAHMRVSDRVDPEGKKILHVEEIQSDWHQEGRKKGYQRKDLTPEEIELKYFPPQVPEGHDPNNYAGYYEAFDKNTGDFVGRHSGTLTPTQAMRDAVSSANQFKTGVPEAPFKKNWHELAMKRLINYAAENGYDSIAITPGAEQTKRYKISSHIDNMTIGDENAGLRQISWMPKNSRTEQALKFDKEGNVKQAMLSELQGKNISEIFGKDLSEKIVQSKPYERIEGVDLDVGGQGMLGFYDKILPDYLNQFGKPYNSQVELGGHKVLGDPSQRAEASERLGVAGQSFADMTPEEIAAFNANLDEANAVNLHKFPITPEMREDVTKQGLPLYQQVGVPVGAGSAASQIELPQQEPPQAEEPTYARGGKVHISDNPDAMFMELHDKMFKRK
jgi:hypothetical protein